MRWILLLFSLASLALMFFGPSTGWVTFGVFGFLFGSIATALAFAQARISHGERQAHPQLHQPHPPAAAPGRSDPSGERAPPAS